MAWPNPADYQEAIQHPELCFADPELKGGAPLTDRWGLPKPVSGAFASVYRVDFRGEKHAVRCFLRDVPDFERRYALISEYLSKAHLPYMVEFKYLKQGIRVRGQWYPILKMDWVEGERLDTYIGRNINSTQALVDLAIKFFKLTNELTNASIAHGDLQHGNILVVGGQLKLIDYDGMYVPALNGWRSNELGQPNYQHPKRSAQDFGLYLDHFSEWVIYLSLVALAVNPTLRGQFSAGSESLLLDREDYLHPEKSKVLRQLEQDGDINVQSMAKWIRYFLRQDDLKQIPALSAPQATAQTQQQTTTVKQAAVQQAIPTQKPSPSPAPQSAPVQPSPSAAATAQPTPATPTTPLRDTGGKPAWLADYLPGQTTTGQTTTAQPMATPATPNPSTVQPASSAQSSPTAPVTANPLPTPQRPATQPMSNVQPAAQVTASGAPANTIAASAATAAGSSPVSSAATLTPGPAIRTAMPKPAPPRKAATSGPLPAPAPNPVQQVEPWKNRGAYTFEYTLLALSVMCLGFLMMVASTATLPLTFVAALAGATAATTAAGLAARYQLHPDTRRKAALSSELGKIERELSRATQRLDKLHNELDHVNHKEQQDMDRLTARQKELVDQEVQQLGRVQDKRHVQTNDLNQRRQQLKQNEQDEKKQALIDLQQQTLIGLLDGYNIASSNIPGVSRQIARQLQSYGITTAGDFQDVLVQSVPGNPDPTVYFVSRGNKRITIPGINSRAALQLLVWRRDLAQRMSSQVPQSLPLKQTAMIIGKYQLQHKMLDYQERRIDEGAHSGTASAHEWYQEQLDQVRKQQQDVPERNKDKRDKLQDEIAEKQKLVNARRIDQARLERDLAPLQSLTFKEYLKHMF